MRLTTKGRYAVMAIVDLASAKSVKPIALADIAERQEISLSYLEQLFAKLRRGGLVKSVRGPGGGYLLAADPAHIRISDIVLAVDEPVRASRCTPSMSDACNSSEDQCSTHQLWEELGQTMHIFLSAVTLMDVLQGNVMGLSKKLMSEASPVKHGNESYATNGDAAEPIPMISNGARVAMNG